MPNEIVSVEKQAGDFLRGLEATLPNYAVREYRGEIFIKSAMMAIQANPDLQECLASQDGRESLKNALRMAAGTGLSLNPQEGKAALVPYGKNIGTYKDQNWIKTASYQVMKGGMIELALDSGLVHNITAETVRENDDFRMFKSPSGDTYEFSPARKDRGAIDGFLAGLKLKDGHIFCQYMTKTEAEDHREKYAKNFQDDKGNLKEGHAWVKSFEGMGQKTILKKLLKSTHINREIDHAVGSDWEPELKNITPEPLGMSSDDLNRKLEDKAAQPKIVEDVSNQENDSNNTEEQHETSQGEPQGQDQGQPEAKPETNEEPVI